MAAGQCIFCPFLAQVTGEHIWPDWLRALTLNKSSHMTHVTSSPMPTPWGPGIRAKFGVLNGPGSPMNRTLPVACARCNSGWMSRLQTRVKPELARLVQGDSVPLDEYRQRGLSAWATMSTMVIDHADPTTTATSQQDSYDLKVLNDPMPNWFIWIGKWRGDPNQFHHRAARSVKPASKSIPVRNDMQFTTFTVGRVLFQTFSAPASAIDDELRNILVNFGANFGLERIWPTRSTRTTLGLPSIRGPEFPAVSCALSELLGVEPDLRIPNTSEHNI